MFMVTRLRARLRGGYYERIRGTPFFSDLIEASAFAKMYSRAHVSPHFDLVAYERKESGRLCCLSGKNRKLCADV